MVESERIVDHRRIVRSELRSSGAPLGHRPTNCAASRASVISAKGSFRTSSATCSRRRQKTLWAAWRA